MPTHEETRERKRLLSQELRQAYFDGQEWGDKALSQRALSERYGLSMQTVGVELQKLVAEGVLYSIPRVGTFMGRPPAQTSEIYLMLTRRSSVGHMLFDQVQTGFEERVALLGGASDARTVAEAVAQQQDGQQPAVAGQFFVDACTSPEYGAYARHDAPCVAYMCAPDEKSRFDSVDFDNEDGGEQAARHLLRVGHRRIAFLGLHGLDESEADFTWSRQRETGWRNMMLRSGQNAQGLNFHPRASRTFPMEAQADLACEAALRLLADKQITAVIAASVYALHGLLQALRACHLPADQWPAIVCFDETPVSRSSGVTYLRLPWEKLGAEAAQLLWERRTGRMVGPAQQRLAKMTLIPRLTCRADWAHESPMAGDRLFAVIANRPNREEAQVISGV